MITREEFKNIVRSWDHGNDLSSDDSPMWIREYGGEQAKWFVCVRPISVNPKYWKWCREHLKGQVLCYSSNRTDETEWWGFVNKKDAMWWTLKWLK